MCAEPLDALVVRWCCLEDRSPVRAQRCSDILGLGGPCPIGEGDRPEGLPGGFGSAVIGEVTAVGADTVTVAALDIAAGTEGGADSTTEQTLAVDATTEVVTTVSATAADVAEGACLTARGDADDLGAVTAESVALSDPVDGSCISGFGGPGGFGGGRGPGSTADDAGQDS